MRSLLVLTLLVACSAAKVPPPQEATAADAGESPDAGPPPDPCEGSTLKEAPLVSPAVNLFARGKAVEAAVVEAGLTRELASFDSDRLPPYFPVDARTLLPAVTQLMQRTLDLPAWSLAAVNDVRGPALNACARASGVSLANVLVELDARNNLAAKATAPLRQAVPDLDQELGVDAPLLQALRAVYAVGSPWARKPVAVSLADAEKRLQVLTDLVDAPTQRALARVVLGMAKAEQYRLEAVKPWYPAAIDFADLATVWTQRTVPVARARSFDYQALARGGIALARVVEQLARHLEQSPLPDTLNFRLATPLGELVINGRAADDDYWLAAPALVVDQRGNDTYHGVVAGPALESIPLSVVIDLSGNDRYLATDVSGTQGAGILSYGFLLDLAGDDVYQAKDFAQGVGALGVGMLWDGAGKDHYTARLYAQGAGQYGLGAAIDLAGDDEWRITSYGQGYGYVRSVGLLLDAAGDDLYDADDTVIVSPSAQDPKHNVSMAQGMGFGSRANDLADCMAGGTGILADLGGNDHYSCALFCQGSGYWYGNGLLYDRGGDDSYKGLWYVQGGAAHFAFGTLIDEAGNDEYVATMNMSQGAGHDGSVGIFLEGGGDDSYGLTHLSHGAANDVGFGYFVEAGGNDTYGTSALSTGAWYGQTASADFSGTARVGVRALGLFLELGGTDSYLSAPPEVKNGASWKLPAEGWGPGDHLGFGKDLE